MDVKNKCLFEGDQMHLEYEDVNKEELRFGENLDTYEQILLNLGLEGPTTKFNMPTTSKIEENKLLFLSLDSFFLTDCYFDLFSSSSSRSIILRFLCHIYKRKSVTRKIDFRSTKRGHPEEEDHRSLLTTYQLLRIFYKNENDITNEKRYNAKIEKLTGVV